MSVTLHMVSSLDGFIATPDNDPSWMHVTWSAFDAGEEMKLDILETIDCYVMGSRTYEAALGVCRAARQLGLRRQALHRRHPPGSAHPPRDGRALLR